MSLKKNFIYNVLYQIIIMITPLITMPYVTRVLKSGGVGDYAYTNSIVQWFILLGVLGFSLYGQREIAYVRDDKKKASNVFWSIFTAKIMTTLISILAYMVFLHFYGGKYYSLYGIQIIFLISSMLDITWFFMGFEDFKKTVTRNIIVKMLGIILLFLFVRSKGDVWKYTLILSCSELFGQLIMWSGILKHVDKPNISTLEIKKHIYKSAKIFIPQVAIQVYAVLDKTMIGFFSNSSEVAYYDMAQKIVKISLAVITSLGTVILPRISSMYSKGDMDKVKYYIIKSFKFVTYISVPMMFGLMGIAEGFVPWFFGSDFAKTTYFILIIAPVLVFIGLNNILGIQVMLPMGREADFTKAVTAGAVFNFGLNLVLIPKFYGLGASIASVGAELIILIIEFYLMRNFLSVKDMFKDTMKYWIISIFMFIIIFIMGRYLKFSHKYIVTILQLIAGGIIYGGLTLLFKSEFTLMIIDKGKSIVKKMI